VSAPKKCIVCRDPRHLEIASDIAGGLSLRKASSKYGYAIATIQKHKTICLGRDYDMLLELARKDAVEAETQLIDTETEVTTDKMQSLLSGAAMITKIDEVIVDAEHIKTMALEIENLGVANQSLNTKLKAVDSYSKLAAEAREREKMKVDGIKSDWDSLRKVLHTVLSHYPGAAEELESELSKQRSITFT